jgi:apurinic endonuclease APN1
MKFGAHVSAAGSLWNAPVNAAAIGCETFQFFSRAPQGGIPSPITDEVAGKFRSACAEHGFDECWIHAPYIINFASAEERIRDGSIKIIRQELERGSALGVRGVMFHPGSAKDVSPEKALDLVAEGLKLVLDGYRGDCRPLIEISAGAGRVIGSSFEEVAEILKQLDDERVGVCFDTAHAFASGYDLRDAAAVKATFDAFDRAIGLERLALSHCNDSKVELGARKDRHEGLGAGHIGLSGFQALLAEPRLKNLSWIVETPPESQASDVKKLGQLRAAF